MKPCSLMAIVRYNAMPSGRYKEIHRAVCWIQWEVIPYSLVKFTIQFGGYSET